QEGRSRLLALVRDFDRDPQSQAWRIRDLLATNPTGFYAGAVEVLTPAESTPARQFLVSLLSDSDLFLKAICDPAISRERSLAIVKAAALKNTRVDVVLAQYLADRVDSVTPEHCPLEYQRLMGILAEVSDGTRILPYLMTLARQTNSHVNSKA